MIDALKRLASATDLECTTSDELVDGIKLKVVTFAFVSKERRQLLQRFWLDLRRGGQAVRRELYAPGGEVGSRSDIQLGSFRIDGAEVWLPVSAVTEGFVVFRDGKVHHKQSPNNVEKIYIAEGTLRFNQHPRPDVFTIQYKPGTPISDNLRKLQYQFGQL
ncbi:MAG: hypothetical protein KGM43_06830 [Planctomycetota bacterium]|nr:hypothetical protein [Planctomycetota bacterium]